MKIKAIEVCGFKSFFEKTSLTFLPGITAMVGPNGCGKSNIVDAIRWAMGEQSAKHLRGNLMEDVIFNGSKSKKPLGMAEVSLTFSNENGNAPALYHGFTEIQVTRRLFRSGESEYYINKTPCRLKDITELFMDTGVGTKAYSIIEQGRVDAIINAKPIDLRLLIEEAAGISKYKARKQEALRKMEATRQNLMRVSDVVGEIKRHISSLAYQAQKLKRFKGLKDRIRSFELALMSQKYLNVHKRYSERKTDLEVLKDKVSALMTDMNSLDAAIISKKIHLQECEESYSATERKALEIKYSIRENESAVERYKQRLTELEDLSSKATKEIAENLQRLRLEEEEIKKSKELTNNLLGGIRELETTVTEEGAKLAELKQAFSAIQKDLEGEREELFRIRHDKSRRENLITYAEKARAERNQRLEQNREELRRAETQQEEANKKLADFTGALNASQREMAFLEHEHGAHEEVISRLNNEITHSAAMMAELKEKKTRCESQCESLKELCRNFEGCSDGVRAIMQRKIQYEGTRNGIYGLVADFIETEPQVEKAVEAVLGEKLQYVIVKSHTEGVEAIEYLKTQALGRGSFVPLEGEKVCMGEEQGMGCVASYATPLITKVKIKDDYIPIVRYLLGDTLLVENFPQALELWKKHDRKHTLVTEEGDVIDPLGVITGGIQHGSGAGYLSKKREIKDLELRLSFLVGELLALQKTHAETGAAREDSEKSLKSIQERLVKQRLAHQGLEKDLRHATEDINRINGKIEFLTLEEEKVSGELVEADEDLALHRSQVGELEAGEALLEESFSRLREQERALREKIELQGEQFDRTKTNLLDLKAQVSSLTSTLTLRENAVRHCKTEISKYEDAKEESIKERAILQENSEHALTLIHELTQTFQTLQDELRKQEQTLDEERDSLRALEEKLKGAQKESNELQLSVQDLNHELSEVTAAIRNLEETMMAKYTVSLPDVASHYPAHQYPEEETTAKLEKLERAREKMMEGINFNAEREYQEQVEKYEFYQSQAEDLNKSLHSLQEAINKINRTSRERFQSTFEKVSENFTHIVPLIYEGGKGELRLTDSDDLLETGVEIMVQPAGKSLKSISLFSGGEKALAAMSLLFALYLFKPTPFCLLDEIDSPLDDANVDRFITILKKFNTNSQFILITHNKKTMETADVLYGITMEEPGVSKIVSVRLN